MVGQEREPSDRRAAGRIPRVTYLALTPSSTPVFMLGWQLILFWATLHFVKYVVGVCGSSESRRDSHLSGTSCNLGWITLHVETDAFNALPDCILRPLKRMRRSKLPDDDYRPGQLVFDISAIIATFLFVMAQLALIWATSKSVLIMWRTIQLGSEESLARRSMPSSPDGLVLRPVVSHGDVSSGVTS